MSSSLLNKKDNEQQLKEEEEERNVHPINIVEYLNEHLINEKSFDQLETLKKSLLKEKQTINKILSEQCSKSTISSLEKECNNSIEELNQLQTERNQLLKNLRQHIDHSNVDTLCKFTTLINQITRIKKYLNILLIIHLFYNKIKGYIDANNLGGSLRPFINLIEIQNNLHCLKSPLITNNEDHQQPCSHLTRLIDHMISDLITLLEKKMKDELKLALKELNWISLSSNTKDGSSSSSSFNTSPNLGDSSADNRVRLLQSSFSNLIILQLTTQKYPLTLPTNNNLSGSSLAASPSTKISNNNNSNNNSNNLPFLPSNLWAIDLLLETLIKGFIYHFQTKRVTNMIEKPEWPIHHVKKLIKDHLPYLHSLQNALNQRGIAYVDVVHWFISGLVNQLASKFCDDIPVLTSGGGNSDNRKHFYHSMDEIITLSQYLQNTYLYPYPSEYGALSNIGGINSTDQQEQYQHQQQQMKSPFVAVFENQIIFDQWINLEIMACQEYFDQLAHSPDCWVPYYKEDFFDLDTMKPSNSAYELISLLRLLTDRFSNLSDVSLQLQFFVKIQLNLLSQYGNELQSLVPSDSYSWARANEYDEYQIKEIASIYNSIIYVKSVLKDWDDQLLFISLYDYMKGNHIDEDKSLITSMGDDDGDNSFSAFHSTTNMYKSIGKQMMKRIVEILFNSFKIKSNLYLKRGAFAQTKSNIFINPNSPSSLLSPSKQQQSSNIKSTTTTTSGKDSSTQQQSLVDEEEQEEQRRAKNRINTSGGIDNIIQESSLDISAELSDALSTLRYQLSILVRTLCNQKIGTLWRKLAFEIDQYLFNLLINNSRLRFTYKDGLQFSKDIKTLFLIFQTFTDKPEKYMKKIHESSLILRFTNSHLSTFKENLYSACGAGTEEKLFNENNIYNLTLDQVETIINIRIE